MSELPVYNIHRANISDTNISDTLIRNKRNQP